MEIIEKIYLRTVNNEITEKAIMVLNRLHRSEAYEGLSSITVLRSVDLDTDLAVFFHWSGKTITKGKSKLGFFVSEAFSDYGITNHSIWKNCNVFLNKGEV